MARRRPEGKGPDYLAMAKALDAMAAPVTADEAEFLDGVIKRLRRRGRLGPAQVAQLKGLYERYIVPGPAAAGGTPAGQVPWPEAPEADDTPLGGGEEE